MKWRKSFREQGVECRQAGNQFLVEVPAARGFFKPKPGFAAVIPACSVIVCVPFKTYCHSAACREMRKELHSEPKNIQNKPCSYCKNPIPNSGVFGLPTYTDVPENHKQDCPIREIMELRISGDGREDEYLKGIMERDNDT